MHYIRLLEIKRLYDNTDQETIKANIKRLMLLNDMKHPQLAALLGIKLHTSYSYTNKANSNKPELFNLLVLASYFTVTIDELLTDSEKEIETT